MLEFISGYVSFAHLVKVISTMLYTVKYVQCIKCAVALYLKKQCTYLNLKIPCAKNMLTIIWASEQATVVIPKIKAPSVSCFVEIISGLF